MIVRTALLAAVLLLASTTRAQEEATRVRDTIRVTGAVEHALTIDLQNVLGYKVRTVEQATDVTCASGEVKKTISTARGVLLRDLLDSAQVQLPHKKARGEFIVYVAASDDYNVIFSWNELMYGAAGENTWLLFEQNGQPILEDGRFIVLCASDRTTGPRHVKWVERIDVRRIRP